MSWQHVHIRHWMSHCLWTSVIRWSNIWNVIVLSFNQYPIRIIGMKSTCIHCCLHLRVYEGMGDQGQRACGTRWIGWKEGRDLDAEYVGLKGMIEEHVRTDIRISFVLDLIYLDL